MKVSSTASRWIPPAIGVALVVLTWGVFGQTLRHDFINYDDRVYVLQNQQVRAGLSLAGVAWAFSHEHAGNWHPLTTISHMLDVQLFGLAPGGHHLVNVLLHSAAVLLLFLVLRRLTGALWVSAFVAAIFAVHPLRVESVAWVAERKDVLSALFFTLTLGAYERYARRGGMKWYLLTAAALLCGLLSKPMLVTVPFVLLLLDYWPLRRTELKGRRSAEKTLASPTATWSRLIVEKIPFVLLCLPVAIATLVIQEHSPGSIAQLPLSWRLENAVVSVVTYIGQLFWPVNLAVFYPYPEDGLPIGQSAGALVLLIAISLGAFALRRKHPYLLVGWLWYLLMLSPVIGVVQVGLQSHADRYTYLPQIGLCFAISFAVVDLTHLPRGRSILTVCGLLLIALCGVSAAKQASYWTNSETLWARTLAVTRDNDVAHTNLGMFLAENGRIEEGIAHLQSALQIRNASVHPHYTLSLALIHNDLGYALAQMGATGEALQHLRESVSLQPDYADAHFNLATTLSQQGQTEEAIREFRQTLALRPTDAEAHVSLGNTLVQAGQVADAVTQYEAALQLAPDTAVALNNLAWIRATSPEARVRNGARAVELAKRAVELSGEHEMLYIRTLAAAYAETGRFSEATVTAERALHLAEAQNDEDRVRLLQKEIDRFRSRIPLRDRTLGQSGQ